MGVRSHKKNAPRSVQLAILTVSTTRIPETDCSGRWMRKKAKRWGHKVVCHKVIPDSAFIIRETLLSVLDEVDPSAIIVSGGTGITKADVTIEALKPLFSKELSAFGALFTQLSFDQIDSAAMLSRATAGIVGNCAVFCIPGSINACKLACRDLIFPELGHLAKHLKLE